MVRNIHFGFVVEYVKDIEAATRFFVDMLGLEVQRTHPTFVQFENFAIATDAPAGGGGPEVYWLVDDAVAAYRELSAHAEIAVPLTEKPFGKVFAVRDADGRPRFLLELSRNRPSR
ncbi:MAG TPA: VOC family protein, partial [Thermoanaerobaculia bacterium]|nr:VOC family protein [Thermoanaerobaculia bacterium]